MMKAKRILASLVSACLVLSLAGCGGSDTAPKGGSAPAGGGGGGKIMTIGTADSGGTMYPVGAGVAKVCNANIKGIKINVATSTGSYENARNIQEGNIDLATIAGDTAYDAIKGGGKFKGKTLPDLRAIGAVYSSLSSWMALKSSGLTMVDGSLKGKTIVVGPAASATETSSLLALGISGVDAKTAKIQNLGLSDGADAVGDGLATVVSGFAGIPISGQLTLSTTKDVNVLGMSDDVLAKILASNPSYYKTVIPKGTYKNQDKDAPTFGVKTLIVVNKSMSDEMAGKIAEALFTHVDDLVSTHVSMASMKDKKFICQQLPIELHPGAAAYYKKQGL